jgi:P pilus assembly chaperone PapD
MRCGSLSNRAGLWLTVMTVVAAVLSPMTIVNADVLVSPLRVYFDDKSKHTATVAMRNPSNGPRTYRLELIEQHMDEAGTQAPYKEGERLQHMSASPYLRISPRQVTVPAQANQTVRVEFRPDAKMAPGEYRSHLLFRVVSELSEPYSVTEIKGSGDSKGMTVKLNMQLSVAIPVVIRHQITEPPQVKVTGVEITPTTEKGKTAMLAVVLQRSGAASSFGRVVVEMQRGRDAPVERIGLSENVSVYADARQRRLKLTLRDPKLPAGAWVRVAYEGIDEYEGRLFGEQTLQIH